MINEIIVLLFGLIVATTVVLMLKKIFFGRSTKLSIDKKVNSRDLFESLENESNIVSDEELFSEEQTFSEEVKQNNFSDDSESLFVINLEGDGKSISYKDLIATLEKNSSNYSNEGGWFRVLSEDHFFSLVNGLNPGRFDTSKEDDVTTALTLILSPISGTHSIINFNNMVSFAEFLASKLDLDLFDSNQNLQLNENSDRSFVE
jgi:FtsZ-interacting cell division protein ZipA